MSGPRRRRFVGPLVSRVTWHGGRGTPYLRRWALIIALATRLLDRVAEGAEVLGDALAVVALDLDGAVLHGAAGAAEPLERSGAPLDLTDGQASDHGHDLAIPAAAVAKDAHDAVVRRGRACRRR